MKKRTWDLYAPIYKHAMTPRNTLLYAECERADKR